MCNNCKKMCFSIPVWFEYQYKYNLFLNSNVISGSWKDLIDWQIVVNNDLENFLFLICFLRHFLNLYNNFEKKVCSNIVAIVFPRWTDCNLDISSENQSSIFLPYIEKDTTYISELFRTPGV